MFRVIALYIRQRFNLPLFLLLALFLMLYANGIAWTFINAVACFFYTLALLFWFRLFDDLASSEVDAGKPGRIYTEERAFRQLRILLAPLAIVLLGLTFLWNIRAGIILASYLAIQTAAYGFLFGRGKWRHILPLLKYPVIALLLSILTGSEGAISAGHLLACLSLLPIFILFESLDDPSYRLRGPVVALLLVAAHLLLAPTMHQGWYPVAVAGMVLMTPIVYAHDRMAALRIPYLLMLYFLLLRVTTIIHVI